MLERARETALSLLTSATAASCKFFITINFYSVTACNFAVTEMIAGFWKCSTVTQVKACSSCWLLSRCHENNFPWGCIQISWKIATCEMRAISDCKDFLSIRHDQLAAHSSVHVRINWAQLRSFWLGNWNLCWDVTYIGCSLHISWSVDSSEIRFTCPYFPKQGRSRFIIASSMFEVHSLIQITLEVRPA